MIRFFVWWIRVALISYTMPVSLFPRIVIAKAGLVTIFVAIAAGIGVGVLVLVVICLIALRLFARHLLVVAATGGKTEAS